MRFYLSPLTVLVFILLAVTNPTTVDYAAWVRQELAGSQANNPLLGFVASFATEPLVQASTERRNLFLFSVFTTRLDDKNQTTTLGFAKNFIALPAPQTAWRPGSPSPTAQHVVADVEPGKWRPADGYVWVVPPPNQGDFRVKWQPGKASSQFSHVVAATAEGRWVPESGYAWNIDPPPVGKLGVHWIADKPSSRFAHVVSAAEEGHWLPAVGYKWLTNPPPSEDLRVVPVDFADTRLKSGWTADVTSQTYKRVPSVLVERCGGGDAGTHSLGMASLFNDCRTAKDRTLGGVTNPEDDHRDIYVRETRQSSPQNTPAKCSRPIYRGLEHHAVIKFLGVTGPLVEREHGVIQTFSPPHTFKFTTSHSNGFSREYLVIDEMQDVSTTVLRKSSDFFNAEGSSAFLITPDLPVTFYYATNREGLDNIHSIFLDDTWKLIGCGGPA